MQLLQNSSPVPTFVDQIGDKENDMPAGHRLFSQNLQATMLGTLLVTFSRSKTQAI